MNIQEAFLLRDTGLRLGETRCYLQHMSILLYSELRSLCVVHTTTQTMAAARVAMNLCLFALAVLNAASTGTRYVQSSMFQFVSKCACPFVEYLKNTHTLQYLYLVSAILTMTKPYDSSEYTLVTKLVPVILW